MCGYEMAIVNSVVLSCIISVVNYNYRLQYCVISATQYWQLHCPFLSPAAPGRNPTGNWYPTIWYGPCW